MDWSRPYPSEPAEGAFPAGLISRVGPPEKVAPLSGSAWRIRAGGRDLFWKRTVAAADEADGLTRLSRVAGVAVPEVVGSGADWLVTEWIDDGARTARSEEALGRALARLHGTAAGEWGGGSSWIGNCRVDPAPAADAVEFYRHRLGDLAARCGLEREMATVIARLDQLLPPGGPALLHGDLWWGNVVFGSGDRPWLIDPSVHGGHPEEDLAMLALFGPVPVRLIEAYREIRPLPDGWQERVGLWQLYPLLVHTALFGGTYRDSVVSVARRYARPPG